jgi:DNA polymerase V
MFALIDCDDFYASCERVFQPELRGRPVIVLSNNDGCVIALSEEAEELGFEMGDPFFEVRDEAEVQGVAVRSSNYTLYGDMSRRVLETLEQFSPHVEEYSIDEVFMRLETPGDATEYVLTTTLYVLSRITPAGAQR